MAQEKLAMSHRMSLETVQKLRALGHDMGISQAAVVQLAIREYWRQNGTDEMLQQQREREQVTA